MIHSWTSCFAHGHQSPCEPEYGWPLLLSIGTLSARFLVVSVGSPPGQREEAWVCAGSSRFSLA